MNSLFKIIFKIGLFLVVVSLVNGGFEAFVNYGFVDGLYDVFIPYYYAAENITLKIVQDICLIVGGIGYWVTPKKLTQHKFVFKVSRVDQASNKEESEINNSATADDLNVDENDQTSDMKQSTVDLELEDNESIIYPDNSQTKSQKSTSNPFEID